MPTNGPMSLSRRLQLASLLSILLALSPPIEAFAQRAELPVLLPLQQPVETLAAGEQKTYRLPAVSRSGDWCLEVEQRGSEVRLEVLDAAGVPQMEIGHPEASWGVKSLVVPGTPGMLRIRLSAASTQPGEFALRLLRLEPERLEAETWMTRAGAELGNSSVQSRASALEFYLRAEEAFHTLQLPQRRAEALHAAALLLRQRQQLPAASDKLRIAADLWQRLQQPARRADALNALGLTYWQLGDLALARAALSRAHELWRALPVLHEAAITHNNLCLLDHASGALTEAEACYHQVIEEVRPPANEGPTDPTFEATVWNNLGGVFDLQGEPDAARDAYLRALQLRRAAGEVAAQAQTLSNLGVVQRTIGDWDGALLRFREARALLDRLDMVSTRGARAALDNNEGYVYLQLAQPRRASALFQQAANVYRDLGHRTQLLTTLNNEAEAQRAAGDLSAARARLEQALELADNLDNPRLRTLTRITLGSVLTDLTDAAGARSQLTAAVEAARAQDNRRLSARARWEMGRLGLQEHRLDAARSLLETALADFEAIDDTASSAATRLDLARVAQRQGRLQHAVEQTRQAVDDIEVLRGRLWSPSQRSTFSAVQHRAYSLLIDLSMELHALEPEGGHALRGFQLSEVARARHLFDRLSSPAGCDTGSDFTMDRDSAPGTETGTGPGIGLAQDLALRWGSLRRRLSAKAARLEQVNTQLGKAAGTDRQTQHLASEVASLSRELEAVETELARSRVVAPRPEAPSLQQVRDVLDPDTLLLEVWLGSARSYLWALDDNSFQVVELPARETIETLVRQALQDLATPPTTVAEDLAPDSNSNAPLELARLLLFPIRSQVLAARRLVVVPDGALHALPLAALPWPWTISAESATTESVADQSRDPSSNQSSAPSREVTSAAPRRWIDRWQISHLPSLVSLSQPRRHATALLPAALLPAAVFADPVFSSQDPRLQRTSLPRSGVPLSRQPANDTDTMWPRLPATRREAQAIEALRPSEVTTFLGFDAHLPAVLQQNLARYAVLHFATHGTLDTRHPHLSSLMLSQFSPEGRPRAGFLRLFDLFDQCLNAELVVLSGCQTGLGQYRPGDGPAGFVEGFLGAGVPRVVASSWRIEDSSTAELMASFYRGLWLHQKSAAASLRRAQLELRERPGYHHPYYWGAFVLTGDWR